MPSCHSTNDVALKYVDQPDSSEGLIVITDEQTAGKGQRGNQWEAHPGDNLTFSLVLKPRFLLARRQFYLSMITALAVSRTLNGLLSANVKVKWPNDVLVDGKKVAGILIESAIQKTYMEHVVIGIGLNVNQEKFKFQSATSLKKVAGKNFHLEAVFEQLIANLEYYYLQLRNGRENELKQAYLSQLFGYKELRSYRAEFEFKGVIEDVSESGHLMISSGGRAKAYDLKEIEFIY